MKKTLLAIAVLAATSSVFAQSSVTVYGVVDASLENVKGTSSVTRVSSDNLATSRLGFKGTEAIGDGLNAKFALETAVKADTGAQGNTARFFDRAAWLGLQGGFGELRLGRIDSSIGALAGDTALLGAQAYDDFKIAKTRAGDSYRRIDNAITYLLPSFVPGLTAQVQYSTAVGNSSASASLVGTEQSATSAGRAFGLNAQYVAGPFSAGLGYLAAKDETGVVTVNAGNKANATLLYAGYDFGMLKLTGYYDTESKLYAGNERMSLYGLKVAVPVTTDFMLTAALSQAKNVATNFTTGDSADFLTFKGVYSLSKRTAVYGLLTVVNNGRNTALGIDSSNVPVAADKQSRGLAFGIRHAF